MVAQKWDYSHRRKKVGRPRIRQVIVDLILRFASENPSWGYDRIQGALANVGYHISDTTVGNVLKQHGIVPAPDAEWMKQIAKNLTDCVDGSLNRKCYLLLERDGKFCPIFKITLEHEGVNPVPLPPKSPNLTAMTGCWSNR